MGKTAVEFKDVVKTYGKGDGLQTAVDHVSFTIDEGEFVVILGLTAFENVALVKDVKKDALDAGEILIITHDTELIGHCADLVYKMYRPLSYQLVQ